MSWCHQPTRATDPTTLEAEQLSDRQIKAVLLQTETFSEEALVI